ncbi:metal ABC transporter ATP-binding protein [Helicobacter sp. MIT 99-5507]|uniref:metal ABC transporter ATP-binding protein n=1 Tax=Helicobacter sp. MIT 99-5507 TaxID=152489 RepID=UPI000E1FB107|nr:ABC transporter ATP-binding protein [Helicobacter sp. MIT 99-5507]RDU57808.1 ABC transporter [Helicobacter sp. MIT 99-5507]
MDNILVCENLSFRYDKDIVLNNISFTLRDGDFLAIIGPNGGGKSTLAKILLNLLKPTSGLIKYPQISLFNKDSLVGYTPQDTSINKDFTIQAFDVVLMGFLEKRLFGYKITKQDKKEALEIMEKLGIADIRFRKIGDLSGGQRQRVLIARALCGNPKLLIFDEPTSSIDLPTKQEIYKLLKEINSSHTIIVITHDISNLLEYASNILFINKELLSFEGLQDNIDIDRYFCKITNQHRNTN